MRCLLSLITVMFLMAPALTSQAQDRCLELHSLFNKNSQIAPQEYVPPNYRRMDDYINVFGHEFKNGLQKGDLVIDAGSGYGLSMLDMIKQQKVTAVAINTQDSYQFVQQIKKMSENEWKSNLVIGWSQSMNTSRFEGFSYASKDVINALSNITGGEPNLFSKSVNMTKEDAFIFYKSELQKLALQIDDLKKQGKFDYKVGFVEDVLPSYQGQASRLTDLWGAYSYSPDRVRLIESYYKALKNDGVAYVSLSERASTGIHYNPVTGGFQTSFESYLVSRYPQIFQIVLKRNNTAMGFLRIKKDHTILQLDIGLKFKRIINEQEVLQTGAPAKVELVK